MRILVVEDEEKIRSFLKKSLEAECFAVDAVDNAEEALQLAELTNYGLLILDNILPKMSGLELCSTLRAKGIEVTIIILSVQSEIDIKVKALDAGADDYLTKPFSLQELLARVRALTRRQPHVERELLEAHDITLDSKRHVVRKGDEEIKLTRKEFMLLEYFMKNIGVVLSRGMIMEHVWDMNADPFSNTIESHVLSLRKKISDGEKTEYIKTISGRGYKFDV